MKTLLSLFCLLFLVAGCTQDDATMKLTGHVKGLKKGTLLLQKIEDSSLISVDSIMVDGDASFVFSEKIESPEVYYLYVRLKDGTLIDDRIAFFAEPGEISINTDLKNFSLNSKVNGSENEDIYQEYITQMQRYSDRNLELIEQQFNAQKEKNDSLIVVVNEQLKSLQKNRFLATLNFAKNHKDHEIAPYLLITQIGSFTSPLSDSVYNLLPARIQDSKYGKELRMQLDN